MALPMGLGDPQDDWRYRDSNNSPDDSDAPMSFFTSPPRPSTNRLSSQSQTSSLGDNRASLHRRFTTNTVPTIHGLSPIGQQRRQAAESQSQDLSFVNQRAQLLEKKRAEYDYIRKKREQFAQEMDLLDQQAKRGEEEIKYLSNDVSQYQMSAGHQSEPTTPPEYRDAGFPNPLSRLNRFSSSSMVSPPGLLTRNGRTNSQVNSPPNERALAYQALTGGVNEASKESEEIDSYGDGILNFSRRSSTANNRKSMPVTRRDHSRNGITDLASILGSSGLGSVDTTGYLFRNSDIDSEDITSPSKATPGYLQMHTNHEKFPILVRRDGEVKVSKKHMSTSDVLDLAASPDQEPSSGWPSFTKASEEAHNGFPLPASSGYATPTKTANPNRHSMGPRIGTYTEPKRTSLLPTPPEIQNLSGAEQPSKSQQSLSTSSVPSVGAIGSSAKRPSSYQAPSTASSDQHLSSTFSPSSNRMSSTSMANARQSNDFGLSDSKVDDIYQNATSSLHASAAPFGPTLTSPQMNYTSSLQPDTLTNTKTPATSNNVNSMGSMPNVNNMSSVHSLTGFANSNGLNGLSNGGYLTTLSQTNSLNNLPVIHNMANLNNLHNLSNLNNPNLVNNMNNVNSMTTLGTSGNTLQQFQNQASMAYGQQANAYQVLNAMNALSLNSATNPQQYQWNTSQLNPQVPAGYGNPLQGYGQGRGFSDNQARVVQQRRTQGGDDTTKFANINLEDIIGEIFSLCKDQHGCRFLQKKLDERRSENLPLIFEETKDHMVELMTDPFGNYLCQKLLEYANDDQRTVLINNAAPHMVKIALNQHGTRALQKMIEYVSTPEQIQTVIVALRDQVVAMIQDLNGNHVIQKCLNRLTSGDAQFIFDAVASNCVTVGTHRHGCCVIQRCIDHASGSQKAQLVSAITDYSLPLVQDPFGNYVLQYIFDQGDEAFSQPLCRTFLGNVAMLSRQKFSSNVVEKCIRIADNDTKHRMIQEMINAPDFDRLVDDGFANYVVQTAWDYAEEEDGNLLAERIRPVLPRMRHKPYGRRFQNRLSERDKRLGIDHSSGTMTPLDPTSPEPVSLTTSGVASPSTSVLQSPPSSSGYNSISSPTGGYGAQSNALSPSYESYGQQHHSISNTGNNRYGIMSPANAQTHMGQFPQGQTQDLFAQPQQNQFMQYNNRIPGPYGVNQY